MKSFILALLPLLAYGTAIERRQFSGLSLMPKMKALKIEEITPQLAVPDAKRVRILYGPYKIKGVKTTQKLGNGKSMDSGGTSYNNDVDTDFPRDITILWARTEVQNKAGKRMELKDGLYNHHTAFFDTTKMNSSPFSCATRQTGFKMGPPPVFAAGATEYGVQVFMAKSGGVKSGYYLGNKGLVMNLIDLVNYNDTDVDVYTSTEIEYVPGRPAGFRESFMALVEPGLCGGPNGAAIHPPKGISKFSINSTDIVMAKGGYLVYTVGHMHDGGVNVVLKINDVEKCNSKALYGGEGHSTTIEGRVWETIRETSACTEPIRVEKGDRIYMQANYDVDLHPSREMGGGHGKSKGGMGGMPMKMKWTANGQSTSKMMDGDAEQMALFVVYFAVDQ